MICKNCNKDIPAGSEYCPECGAPMDEPVVISMTKEDIKNANKKLNKKKSIKHKKSEGALKKSSNGARLAAEGPLFNLPGYAKSLKDDSANFLGLIGALILFYSPFMTWLWEELWEKKKTASLFDMGGKSAELALGKPVIIFFAVLVLITAIAMLAESARENIRPLRPYADNILIRLAPVAAAIIILILIMVNKEYSVAINNINEIMEKAENMGASKNYDGGRGIGIVFYIAGTVIYTLSVVFDMSKGKKK